MWTQNGEEWETETQGVGRRRRGRRERPRDKAETQRYTLERGVVRDSRGLSDSDDDSPLSSLLSPLDLVPGGGRGSPPAHSRPARRCGLSRCKFIPSNCLTIPTLVADSQYRHVSCALCRGLRNPGLSEPPEGAPSPLLSLWTPSPVVCLSVPRMYRLLSTHNMSLSPNQRVLNHFQVSGRGDQGVGGGMDGVSPGLRISPAADVLLGGISQFRVRDHVILMNKFHKY